MVDRLAVLTDVTDDASVAAAHEGVLDALINNAGVHGPHGDPSELTGADALGVFDVDVQGPGAGSGRFIDRQGALDLC